MTVTTRLYTALCGQLVGKDVFGNRYYRKRGRTHGRSSVSDIRKTEKRWVLYNGAAEPSKVPPEWHGWLHYTHAEPPVAGATHHVWEKEPRLNLTGTPLAYLPPGHLEKGAHRSATTADYQPWNPNPA